MIGGYAACIRGLTNRQPSVVSSIARAPRSQAPSALSITYGARVIDSTPPAMNTSPSPAPIAWAAEFTACRPGAAQPVDGLSGHLDREPGEERGHARDVAVVLARPVGAAEDDVLDQGPVDAGPLDDGRDGDGGEVVGPDGRQRPAVAADGGPDRVDDPRLAERAG